MRKVLIGIGVVIVLGVALAAVFVAPAPATREERITEIAQAMNKASTAEKAAYQAELNKLTQNDFSAEARRVLENAREIELVSLTPQRAGDGYFGYQVLGRTSVKDPARARALIGEFRKSVEANGGWVAACFNPRHGLHASHEGNTVDLVICFECAQTRVYLNGKSDRGVLNTGHGADAFNAALREANVALASR